MISVMSERERFERYWESRTKEADLNFAVIAFATRCAAEGDLDALTQLGFDLDDVRIIEQIRLSDLHALSASRGHALNIRVDRAALHWLFEHVRRRRTREALKLELLRLEAPYQMMAEFFGLNSHEYAAARALLRLPDARGKPTLKCEAEEQRLWDLWVALADAEQPTRLRREDLWLIVGREIGSDLRVAWNAVQRWAVDPVSLEAFHQERRQWPPQRIEEHEASLRDKHRVHRYGSSPPTRRKTSSSMSGGSAG
ncbi:MAG: STY4526/YPO1902 family pathogenicity island replication protein [Pseudomonadota bacterium]|nr:STY4526/YPO1902 family pathogenicity island replication protein [Pseudomonadota bacterium]